MIFSLETKEWPVLGERRNSSRDTKGFTSFTLLSILFNSHNIESRPPSPFQTVFIVRVALLGERIRRVTELGVLKILLRSWKARSEAINKTRCRFVDFEWTRRRATIPREFYPNIFRNYLFRESDEWFRDFWSIDRLSIGKRKHRVVSCWRKRNDRTIVFDFRQKVASTNRNVSTEKLHRQIKTREKGTSFQTEIEQIFAARPDIRTRLYVRNNTRVSHRARFIPNHTVSLGRSFLETLRVP